ncbi:hypothetical protein [Novipirellula galeiformis]|uniref:hypothetical protein n=1 Tax=Novipirellula galeiformis TaxID=2528004 RepID=UPI0018CC90FF|nr:hypothetical protein [Novipirellula galeiformis]
MKYDEINAMVYSPKAAGNAALGDAQRLRRNERLATFNAAGDQVLVANRESQA